MSEKKTTTTETIETTTEPEKVVVIPTTPAPEKVVVVPVHIPEEKK